MSDETITNPKIVFRVCGLVLWSDGSCGENREWTDQWGAIQNTVHAYVSYTTTEIARLQAALEAKERECEGHARFIDNQNGALAHVRAKLDAKERECEEKNAALKEQDMRLLAVTRELDGLRSLTQPFLSAWDAATDGGEGGK